MTWLQPKRQARFLLTLMLIPLSAPAADSDTIKALTADQIDDYLSGRGMGLAKAAELNGYPGPSHVLSLADDLSLTPVQRRKTEALQVKVVTEAKRIGELIVTRERELDALFAAQSADRKSIAALTGEIGRLQGQLRFTHLQAHLEQARLLNTEQISRYQQLRGYRQ